MFRAKSNEIVLIDPAHGAGVSPEQWHALRPAAVDIG